MSGGRSSAPRRRGSGASTFTTAMAGLGKSAAVAPSKGLDADAPYLVESYQNSTGNAGTDDPVPAYTYSADPHGAAPAQKSWDEAARAKANPIRPAATHNAGHVYIDVDAERMQQSESSAPTFAPAPINSTITGYATALGWDLSKLCALTYIFPPFTSIFVLIWETQNVRGASDAGSCPFPRLSVRAGQCGGRRHVVCAARDLWLADARVAACACVADCVVVLCIRRTPVCYRARARSLSAACRPVGRVVCRRRIVDSLYGVHQIGDIRSTKRPQRRSPLRPSQPQGSCGHATAARECNRRTRDC